MNEFAPDGFGGFEDDEGFNPEIAKMAQEHGFAKGVSLADGATLEMAMKINHWHTQHGGIYKQYFAKGFMAGRMNKINHDNRQYNLNLKLMKDGSIRHGEQGVAECSLNEFAPGGDFKPPLPPKKKGNDPWGDDNRSQIAQAVKQLLAAGNKVDWKVPGQMGHVVSITDDGVIMKRWAMPRSKMRFFLPLMADRDAKYQILMVRPGYYKVVSSDIN